jgi:hypothetical protein
VQWPLAELQLSQALFACVASSLNLQLETFHSLNLRIEKLRYEIRIAVDDLYILATKALATLLLYRILVK